MAQTTLSAPRISGRDRVIVLPNNKIALTSKSRRRYKMSAKARRAMAAARKRFYVPILTSAAVGVPVWFAWQNAKSYSGSEKLAEFGGSLLAYYTGFYPKTGDWKFKRLQYGLIPLGILVAVKKIGLFKGVNQVLARAKVPLRLS